MKKTDWKISDEKIREYLLSKINNIDGPSKTEKSLDIDTRFWNVDTSVVC